MANAEINNRNNLIATEDLQAYFPKRSLPERKEINFVVGTQLDGDQKLYQVELDTSFDSRVGDLLEAIDGRTRRRYLMMVFDIEYAFQHREEHAHILELLRRRPDKEVDEPTFRALCKNLAVCNLLGEILPEGISERGYRPSKYTSTVIRAAQDVEALMTSGWHDGVRLGCLRVGRERREGVAVHFPTWELAGKRLLTVGQTGGGKSTAIRWMLHGHIEASQNKDVRKVGFLVDDFKMEYPFDISNEKGETVKGLATKLGGLAKEKLVILTCNPEKYESNQGSVRDIIKLKLPLSMLSLSVFCDIAELTPAQTNFVRLVEDSGRPSEQFFKDVLTVDEYGMPDSVVWGKNYGRIFYSDSGKKKAKAVKAGEEIQLEEDDIDKNLRDRLSYVRRAVTRLLNMPFVTRNKDAGDCTSVLLEYLRDGCVVILDKSSLEDYQREMLTIMLLYYLFRHNQKFASGGQDKPKQMIPVVAAIEEAQYLLSNDKVADPDSIFAKIAFTGRSYQIGLLAITQRPQAIQKELLGQFDGFLVLPLEHVNDFRHLADACPVLASYRNDLASAPKGGAVLAYGSPKKVVSIQVDKYV